MESEIQQLIQMTAMKFHKCVLMRNNSGGFTDQTGRFVRFGLGHTSPKQQFKSSDLIGITEVVITQEMVGKTLGVFTAVELKDENWNPNKKLNSHEEKQNNFLQFVISKGGIAGFVNKVDDLKDIFRR